jgi:hypothetical protein
MNEENQTPELDLINQWTKDLKLLPPFTQQLLEKHLISDIHKDNSVPGAFKHKKLGYGLFKERYVTKVQVKPNVQASHEIKFLVKAMVHASMKQKSYVVYVHLNQLTGEVVHASCACKAGKGECCKHVAALLFQIIDYIQLELAEVPDDLTCTQLLQQWHVPRSDETDEPVLLEDIRFKKHCYKQESKTKKQDTSAEDNVYNPTPHFAREPCKSRVERLAKGLEEAGKASYLSKLLQSNNCVPASNEEFHERLPSKRKCTEAHHSTSELYETDIRDQVLESLKTDNDIDWSHVPSDEDRKFVSESLKKSHEGILEIERNTREQSNCTTWYEERNKRLTASNFGAVLNRKKNNYPKSILGKVLSKGSMQSMPTACKWGNSNEMNGIKKYRKWKEEQNQTVNVCSFCGFIINATFPWLGASPDFLTRDLKEDCNIGLGEVKCPYSKREMTIQECCEDPHFFLSNANGEIKLKQKHVYFYQVQGAMATLKLQWFDFVVFTSKDLHVERIYFDKTLWENVMLPELTRFYFQYVLPRVISGK